jgi:hypothetical protein
MTGGDLRFSIIVLSHQPFTAINDQISLKLFLVIFDPASYVLGAPFTATVTQGLYIIARSSAQLRRFLFREETYIDLTPAAGLSGKAS